MNDLTDLLAVWGIVLNERQARQLVQEIVEVVFGVHTWRVGSERIADATYRVVEVTDDE